MADNDINFDDLPRAGEAGLSFDDLPNKSRESSGVLRGVEAGVHGAVSGATAGWAPELGGLSKASGIPEIGGFLGQSLRLPIGAARLAYEHYTNQPGSATEEYERAHRAIKEHHEALQKSNPLSYGAGEIGGSLIPMAVAPEAELGFGLRALQGAGYGAGYGAAEGAHSGFEKEGLTPETAKQAGIGAFFGGLGGAGGEAVGTGANKLISHGIGLMTGAGAKALETATGAGMQGGAAAKAFRENLRQSVQLEDVVKDANKAVSQMYKERGSLYQEAMEKVGANKRVLNFDRVNDAMAATQNVKRFKGIDLEPSTAETRAEIDDVLSMWRRLPRDEYHTAAGFDALKQRVGNILDKTDPGSPERRVAQKAYEGIRQTIIDEDPAYGKIMKGYEKASSLIREIEKTFSLPKDNRSGPTIDTSLRKLQSVLRNNVNTGYGRRDQLAQYLVNSGAPHLMEAIAGQTLHPAVPRGLAQITSRLSIESLAAALGLGGAGLPAAAAVAGTLPFMSPRLMGEAAYYTGRARGLLPTGANPLAVRSGVEVGKEIFGRAHGGRVKKDGEKMTHSSVGYVMKSPHRNKSCGLCSMFVPQGPACTLVQSPIASGGYCRRFERA